MLPLQLLNVIGIIIVLYFVIDLFAADQSDSKVSLAGGLASKSGFNALTGSNAPEYGNTGFDPVPVHSSEDGNSLLFIREKERLVRAFYKQMYERWNADVFKDLIEDEDRHIAAISVAIPEGLRLEDADRSSWGSRLKTVFPKITRRGEKSLEDAIVAGVMLEMWALSDAIEMEDKCCSDELRNLLRGFKNHCCNHIRMMKNNLFMAA